MADWREEKKRMIARYHEENAACAKGETVFTGSSLMEMFPMEAWAKERGVIAYNRGVGGYRTDELLPVIDICACELQPRKVFINIGTNDLSDASIPIERVMENYEQILSRIEEAVPGVIIYLMAYYPINEEAAAPNMRACLRVRNNQKICLANAEVEKLAKKKENRRYIDVNAPLKDEQGRLKAEYTIEGMHIRPEGYRAIFDDVMRYVLE